VEAEIAQADLKVRLYGTGIRRDGTGIRVYGTSPALIT
jgi:hypothetical protein